MADENAQVEAAQVKIGLLPVDGRPCTRSFPVELGELAGHQVLTLAEVDLGYLKRPASISDIQMWLRDHARDVDGWILSADMLLYGGLVPSRIGHEPLDLLTERMDIVRELKELNPQAPLYVFSSIMRMNHANLSEEEPDYWADYGVQLCRLSHLTDKVQSGHSLDVAEQAEWQQVRATLPEAVVRDVTDRRRRNFEINRRWFDLVESGVVDIIVFPQDDCSQFGWNIEEQRSLRKEIRKRGLDLRALIYPGADEVAQTLLARLVNNTAGRQPTVFPFYSSAVGPLIRARYEDRPIAESVKGQVFAAGGLIVFNPQEADIALAVNTPGEAQGDLALLQDLTLADTPSRNIPEFIAQIKHHLSHGRSVAVADLAYANGADPDFIPALVHEIDPARLAGFSAWNTAGNALGTVIAHSFLLQDAPRHLEIHHHQFVLKRFADDYLYQSVVRVELYRSSPDRTCAENSDLPRLVEERLGHAISDFAAQYFRQYEVTEKRIFLPWDRLFEVGIHLSLAHKSSF